MNRKDAGTIYEVPKIEIVRFDCRDIVTSSALSNEDHPNYDPNSWT